jgi:hypothetical protein
MKKNRLSYFFVDPGADGYSASRLALLWLVLVDTGWAVACILGLPQKEAFVPVSTFLGTCTAAVCGVYAVNSGIGAWKNAAGEIASTVFRKTTTVTKDEGVRGEEEKKTTTVTSQVDSGPKEKVVPALAKPQGE